MARLRVAWWPGGRIRLKTVSPARAAFRAASPAPGAVRDLGKKGRVRIEILRLVKPRQVFGCVRPQEGGILDRAGLTPLNGQLGLSAELFPRHGDALGAFRM